MSRAAKTSPNIHCPDCSIVMAYSYNYSTVRCIQPKCAEYDVHYTPITTSVQLTKQEAK